LDFYKKAFKIMKGGFKENISLYYNIACCLSNLGYYTNVVMFIDNACDLNTDEQETVLDFAFDNLLAINLIRWGYLKRANKLLFKCLLKARKDNNDYFIGSCYHNLGHMYLNGKNWEMAVSYFDKAFGHFTKGSNVYLKNLYYKTRCLVKINDHNQCLPLIEEGRELSKDNEDFTVMFESLKHLMTPNESESLKYLETKAIPYLLKRYENITALDYSEFLHECYKKNKQKTKALEIAEIWGTIYRNITKMGVVE